MNVEIEAGVLPRDTVFVHGNLGSFRWWEPSRQELQLRKSKNELGRMVMTEWRGCGQTDAPASTSDLRMDKLARDHIELVKNLNLDRPALVGHSTGGAIVLEMALQEPKLFSHVVLLDPIAADGVDFTPEMLGGFELMRKDRGICQMVMATTIYGVDTASPQFQGIVDDAFSVAPLIWTDIPKVLSRGEFDITARLAQFELPVTLIHGVEDVVLPIEGSRRMAELLPNCRLIEIPGQGHSLNVENPKKFIDLLLGTFL